MEGRGGKTLRPRGARGGQVDTCSGQRLRAPQEFLGLRAPLGKTSGTWAFQVTTHEMQILLLAAASHGHGQQGKYMFKFHDNGSLTL